MTFLTFCWALSGLLIGYLNGSPDVRVIGWILLGMAAVLWFVNRLYTGYVENRNASDLLAATEQRRKDRGAL